MSIVDDHLKFLKRFKGTNTVEAGWFETSRYQAGKDVPDALVGVPVARIARINEFGATIKHASGKKTVIPARPFMRKASMDFQNQRGPMTVKLTKQYMRGKITEDQMLGQIGMFMEGLIVNSIKNGGWVENAPATVEKKGFNKPLIETGQMWQAVTSKVVKSK